MTIHCPAFDLPDSSLISEQSHKILAAHRARIKALIEQSAQHTSPPSSDDSDSKGAEQKGAEQTGTDPKDKERQMFYRSEPYQYLVERYPVDISLDTIAGVPVEIVTPREGIKPNNQQRVLINFHGGGFVGGSQTLSRMESIPVAVLAGMKVISVDYRMAPEHRFPAATDDAFTVYQALLQTYQPHQLGIFGSSAGAFITAQLMVRLQEQGLPLPAAIALIAGGAFRKTGDSMAFAGAVVKAVHGVDLGASNDAYFRAVDTASPQVTPGLSDHFMANFPPTFLAASTRDFALSPVVATQRRLVNLGVPVALHLWEGLEHIFHCNTPDLPETEELHQLTVAFFDTHLGRSA